MTKIVIFPLTLRSSSNERPASPAEVATFPYSRRRHLVERHASAMRGMSGAEGEGYLTTVLEQVCEDLGKLGLDCRANDAIDDFADAIGKQLHGPQFSLKIEGGAE